MKKPEFVPEWRLWWRLWSVRLPLIGLAFLTFFLELPDAALSIWLALPTDIKNLLPPDFGKYLGYFLVFAGTIARIIKQRKLPEGTEDQSRRHPAN